MPARPCVANSLLHSARTTREFGSEWCMRWPVVRLVMERAPGKHNTPALAFAKQVAEQCPKLAQPSWPLCPSANGPWSCLRFESWTPPSDSGPGPKCWCHQQSAHRPNVQLRLS